MIYREALPYTKPKLKDDLEKYLASSLNHQYLLDLQQQFSMQHYLLIHWTTEFYSHIGEVRRTLLHTSKLGVNGKRQALREVEADLRYKARKHREGALAHFQGVFGSVLSTKQNKLLAKWIISPEAELCMEKFWAFVWKLCDETLGK